MVVAPVTADNRIDGDDPRASHSSPAARAPSRTLHDVAKARLGDLLNGDLRHTTHPPAPLPLSVPPPPAPPNGQPQKDNTTKHRATLGVDAKKPLSHSFAGSGEAPNQVWVIFRFCDAPPGPSSRTTPPPLPPSPQKHPPRRRCWVPGEHFRISQAKGTSAEQRYVPFSAEARNASVPRTGSLKFHILTAAQRFIPQLEHITRSARIGTVNSTRYCVLLDALSSMSTLTLTPPKRA